MKRFRYDTRGNWYKGNTHIHTQASDGGKTLTELSRLYGEKGYDFLFQTDHWVAATVREDGEDYPVLWLNGVELDGTDHTGASYHVVCLGTFSGIMPEKGFAAALELARQQEGLLILAHPHWCGNSLDDALRYRFDGVEVYNHVCRWLNGKSDGLVYWDAMLNRSPDILGFAADDTHLTSEHPGWNGGWIKVNAVGRTRKAILSAVKAGNYYSSCGPDFLRIEGDEKQVRVVTSPVRFIRLVGPAASGERVGSFDSRLYTEATFDIPDSWSYARLEIEDEDGRRAWSNTLFSSP